ncbi:hypothetical protein Glove_60g105 [Diversispora epigaea]|uniref:Uncharacterized protein n=1 Tax=Diversispora epigaea TaxID=1348612 RepID=A0A397JLK3_9GLOM|nr:hypothetical protein Glove_60g105 [Diversispora epigaea]
MEERIQLCDDNLDEFCSEKRNYANYYSQSIEVQLVDLWDEPYCEQSADEIYELLSQEVSRLQELYACQWRASLPHHLFQFHSDYWKKNGENLVGPI